MTEPHNAGEIGRYSLQLSELSLEPYSIHSNLSLSVFNDAGIVMNFDHFESSLGENLYRLLCTV
jgi:hypothetical protein